MLWEPAEQKYMLHFGPEIGFPQTENAAADILAATQICTTCSKPGFAAILTSGSGFIAAGKPARRVSRRCTVCS